MYSCADGKFKPYQVGRIAGQVEHGVGFMLGCNLLSPYTTESARKGLADITGKSAHYAIDTTTAIVLKY